jgi:uncharacterized protein (TIGR03067 family)
MVIGLAMSITLPALAPGGGNKDELALDGTWVFVESSYRGKKVEPAKIAEMKWVITKNRIVLKKGDSVSGEFQYKLDNTKSPRLIDITNLKSKETERGIYELKGDTLRICTGPEDGERANAFKSEEDPPNESLTILKRSKQ